MRDSFFLVHVEPKSTNVERVVFKVLGVSEMLVRCARAMFFVFFVGIERAKRCAKDPAEVALRRPKHVVNAPEVSI